MDQSNLRQSCQTLPTTIQTHIRLSYGLLKAPISIKPLQVILQVSSPSLRRNHLLESMGKDWKSANELEKETFIITTKSAVKFLLSLKTQGIVEVKEQEFIDQRYRKRTKLLFRLKQDNSDCIEILNNLFGIRVPEVKGVNRE